MKNSIKFRPYITVVEAVEKYRIKLSFADGTSGIYDLSHLAGRGVFKNWDDDNNFFKVFVDSASGTISWPGGTDIDALKVYCSLRGLDTEEYVKDQGIYAAN